MQERIRLLMERRHTVRLNAALNKLTREASAAYASSGSVSSVDSAINKSDALDPVLRSMYTESVHQAKTHAMKEMPKKMGSIDIEKKGLISAIDKLLKSWIGTRTAQKVKQISKTTKEKVRSAIAQGTEEGLGQSAIAKLILSKNTNLNRNRAKVIARTETHAAMQSSSLAVAENIPSGLPLKKQWVSVEDNRTRHSHREADGQMVPTKEKFDVNGFLLSYPGDPSGPAGEIINCRCVMVYQEQTA